MVTDTTQRDIGRMETQIATLSRELIELRADVRAIRETLAEARGGWKTLLMIAGFSAFVGGLIVKLSAFIRF